MGASPFQAAMERVAKPLVFAARDDFAHLDRLRDVEQTVARAAASALRLSIPRDARAALKRVEQTFAAALEGPARVTALRRAQQLVAAFADPDWPETALARPTTALPGVGPKWAESLAARGLRSVGDLLFHLPSRYDDRRSLASVGELEVGRRATFVAQVLGADFAARRGRGRVRRPFEAIVGDETGTVGLKWFHGGESMASVVRKGGTLLVTGDVKRYRFSKELVHPEVEMLDDGSGEEEIDLDSLRQVVPDYPSPEGLHPRALRRIVRYALEQYADLIAGQLPPTLMRERGLPPCSEALRQIHAPGPEADLEALQARAILGAK